MRPLALITGGTSGIGLAVARALAASHDLALAYAANHERAAEAARSLAAEAAGARVTLHARRLQAYRDAEALTQAVREAWGRSPDVLVYAAGSIRDGLFLDTPFAQQEALLGEHLIAAMALAQLLVKEMYRAKRGRIVFLSSIGARFVKRGQCGYAAAKAGIEGFTRALALEVAHRGITVNAVAPGLIDTPMTADLRERWAAAGVKPRKKIPAGRFGEPGDVAALVKFLCGEEAGYITGSVHTVDGGRSLGDPS